MRTLASLLLAAAAVASAAGAQTSTAPPIRVLIVTGGHEHDPSFYRVFDDTQEFQVTVDPHPNAYRRDFRQAFDVLVCYDMMREMDETRRRNLRDFVESGKGVVLLHHAIGDNDTWNWWVEEVAGGRYVFSKEADRPASTYRHDETVPVEVVMDHPVTKGVGPFTIHDETYHSMWISPKVKVLLKTSNPTSDGPVAWISPYEKSRVVYIELGHDHQAHRNPAWRKLVVNAVTWAAGRN